MTARHLGDTRGNPARRSSSPAPAPHGSLLAQPDSWLTGGQPMTEAQAAYLKMLCEHAGEAFYAGLTKAEASKRIRALRSRRW